MKSTPLVKYIIRCVLLCIMLCSLCACGTRELDVDVKGEMVIGGQVGGSIK